MPINLSSLRSKKHSTTWTNLQTFIPNDKLCREIKKIQYQGTVWKLGVHLKFILKG